MHNTPSHAARSQLRLDRGEAEQCFGTFHATCVTNWQSGGQYSTYGNSNFRADKVARRQASDPHQSGGKVWPQGFLVIATTRIYRGTEASCASWHDPDCQSSCIRQTGIRPWAASIQFGTDKDAIIDELEVGFKWAAALHSPLDSAVGIWA